MPHCEHASSPRWRWPTRSSAVSARSPRSGPKVSTTRPRAPTRSAAGVSRALGLDERRTAHALAIAAPRTTRCGSRAPAHLSHWKGLAYPTPGCRYPRDAPCQAWHHRAHARSSRATRGSWSRSPAASRSTGARGPRVASRAPSSRSYNAEIHSQSAIEGLLELRAANRFAAEDVEKIELETFDVATTSSAAARRATSIAVAHQGGGRPQPAVPAGGRAARRAGGPRPVRCPSGSSRADVQALLRRVSVRPSPDSHAASREQMPPASSSLSRAVVASREKPDYEGFFTPGRCPGKG